MKNLSFSEILKAVALTPDWLVAMAVFIFTAIIALFVFRVLRAVLVAALKAEHILVNVFIRRAGGIIQFAFVLLALAVVAPALPLDHATTGILNRILIAAFVILGGWLGALASDMTIEHYILSFKLDVEDNLLARKAVTQMRVLKRTAEVLIAILTTGFALMTFDTVREFGISLFASAGIAGLAVGLAAKPLLSNLIAGVQIAISQPIRIDDVVVIEGEWGWVEEFAATYVVIRIWDQRRLVVPLNYFFEKPFQNWTRSTSSILGSATFYLDYTADIDRVRRKFDEIIKGSPLWDGNVANLQVVGISERCVEIRALASARDSTLSWDLRCELREKILDFLRREYPEALPRLRADLGETTPRHDRTAPEAKSDHAQKTAEP